jgi:hypothetical protein
MVDGVPHSIEFRNGTTRPFVRNGKFTTDDVKLQKAIEEDVSYGRQFILITPVGDSHTEKEPVKEVDLEPIENDSNTVQGAKKFLLEKYPDKVKISTLTNRNKVVEAGVSLNVTFPNLLQA